MRILIADDDLTARLMLTGILKKWGYEVVSAQDGMEAWDILQQADSPLLVILDWVMPGIDGLEVIRRVRAQSSHQPPYIILLTSKDDKGDILSGLDTGANDYVKKPFDLDELIARLRVGQRTIDLQTRLYEAQQRLEHLASRDALTGAFNRRAIIDQLKRELSRMRREKNAKYERAGLSIGYFDIDRFKHVNDTYGHQAGDDVLVGLTGLIHSQIRAYDSLGRLGGDEFIILAPGINESNRCKFFERLIALMGTSSLATCAGEIVVQVSMGVVTVSDETSVDTLLEKTDLAMYEAKRHGGNRVIYCLPSETAQPEIDGNSNPTQIAI